MSKKLAGHLEQLGSKDRTRKMQKSALFGSQKSAGSLRSRDKTWLDISLQGKFGA